LGDIRDYFCRRDGDRVFGHQATPESLNMKNKLKQNLFVCLNVDEEVVEQKGVITTYGEASEKEMESELRDYLESNEDELPATIYRLVPVKRLVLKTEIKTENIE